MAGRARGVVVQISAEENTGRAFAAVDAQVAELRAQVRTLKAELAGGGPGEALGQGMSHAVPEIAAASGAIREFEGNLPIRAVERFLTTTLGLGPALALAFPAVGAIALIGVIGDAIAKFVELYEAGKKAPAEIGRAFEDLTLKMKLSNDELDRTNVKLQEEIDKIEGHKGNGIQAALDEAKVSADKLLVSLRADIVAIEQLTQKPENQIGIFEGLFSGQTSTRSIDKDVHKQGDKLSDDAFQALHKFDQALADAGTDETRIAAAKKAYYDQLDKDFGDYISRYQKKVDDLRAIQKQQAYYNEADKDGVRVHRAPLNPFSVDTNDHSGEIKVIEGAIAAAQLLRDRLKLTQTNDTLTAKRDSLKGEGGGDSSANKLADARKALDDAIRKQREQAAQDALADAKQLADLELAQLDDKHKRLLVSDQDYYAQRLAIQKKALDAEDAANSAKQGALADQLRSIIVDRGRPGLKEPDVIRDNAKIIEIQTQIATLEEQRKKIAEERTKLDISGATQAYEIEQKRVVLADELASKVEQIIGGSVAAQLKQLADAHALQRQGLVANFGEGSQEVSDADFAFSNQQGRIRLKGAEQTSAVDLAGINAKRQAITDEAARGRTTTQDAQRQRIELDAEEAQALQPVLKAYQQLAEAGDLEASQKVIELKTRIGELQNPVDEVAGHIRDSFDGAFESLFENLDQGLKGFENFAKSIERLLEQAAYKKFLEPLVQKGLNSLIPNKPGGGYGDPGIGGVKPFIPPNPTTDIGAGVGQTALKGLGINIPGLSGAKKGNGSTITIQLLNDSALPLKIGDTSSQGQIDPDQVLAIIHGSFEEGGLMRSLLTGFGGGGG